MSNNWRTSATKFVELVFEVMNLRRELVALVSTPARPPPGREPRPARGSSDRVGETIKFTGFLPQPFGPPPDRS
jgi:hypothetical protein